MKRDKFAQKIRELRENLGYTQEGLAKKSGVSVRTVCSIERGRGCNLRTLRSIAKALEVDSLNLVAD